MKTTVSALGLGILTGLGLTVLGCSNTRCEQRAWGTCVTRVEGASRRLRIRRQEPLTIEHLVALLGPPDYRVTPFQLQELFADSRSREEYCQRLWCAWRDTVGAPHTELTLDQWRDCEEFVKADVWVYDESVNFTRPMAGPFLVESFIACFFFVQDCKVVASDVEYCWPRPALPQGQEAARIGLVRRAGVPAP